MVLRASKKIISNGRFHCYSNSDKETIANVKLYSMLENHNDNIFCVGDEAGTAVVYEYRSGCKDLVKVNFELTLLRNVISRFH